MFEWIARNKATDAASKTAWDMLAEVCPREAFPQSYSFVKGILTKYIDGKVTKIDVCANGCIAYHNCTSEPLAHHKYAHLQECPVCDLSRSIRVQTRYGDTDTPRAKMYYLGVADYFRELFRQPDVAMHLDYNTGTRFPGNIKQSRGFHRKVLTNPLMNGDGRNQAVIATADGVPLFKDMTARKGHPFMLRPANADEHLQKDLSKAHLFGYYPCESYDVDEHGRAERIIGAPTSFQPLMTVFSDEMHRLYHDGIWVEDSSRPSTDPDRMFLLRVLLLYWIGDYPGLAEICDFRCACKM